MKSRIAEGTAIEVSTRFTFNNSLAKGRKMTSELAKLMLRAYNAEAENCVRYVKAGNLTGAERRLTNATTAIARYASMMEMRINPAHHELRLRELALTADYQMKVQEDEEAEREERARLREEARAERELRAERERLEKNGPLRADRFPLATWPCRGRLAGVKMGWVARRRRLELGCSTPSISLAPGPDLEGSRTVALSTPVRISVPLTEAPGRSTRCSGMDSVGGQAKWEHDAETSTNTSRRWCRGRWRFPTPSTSW
jgi:Domain of unknown function (DUF4041)